MLEIFAQYYEPFIPDEIKVLFLAESPPAYPGEAPIKYFYMTNATGAEPLFSTIMLAIYDIKYKRNPEYKQEILNRFCNDGYFLMDAVEYPINTPDFDAETEIKKNKERFTERIEKLRTDGRISGNTKTILVKQSVYNVYKNYELLNIQNNESIGFPYWCNNEKIAGKIRDLISPTSKEKLLEYIRANSRICPVPTAWNGLWQLLRNKKRKGGGWEPALPLILAAWWDTSGLQKMMRLIEHIEWAESNGQLEEISKYLFELKEEEWHHLGE